jgi:hypothetical protein
MSKLIENKHMIHIASEIVVLLGLTFYFNQKNKKIMGHIQDLSQRIEEQEDLLQKHEQVIKKLVDFISKQQSDSNNIIHQHLSSPNIQIKNHHKKSTPVVPTPTKPPAPVPTPTKEVHTKHLVVTPTPLKPEPSKVTVVPLAQKPRIEEIESEDEEESDLDTELAEELGELEDSDNEDLVDLKKR